MVSPLFQLALVAALLLSATDSAFGLVPLSANKGTGQAACDALTKQLGSSKVLAPLNLAYTATVTDYWNKLQALNKPACVVQPANTQDVSVTMKAIRAANSTMAVKAAGHNTNNGWSSTNGGVTIDLTKMLDKSFDAATETATFQPGSEWGPIYQYYEQFNRTVVGGRLSFIGPGLALGGGLSHLSQNYGFACDNFRSLEVVLADGSIVTATQDNEHKDLFLALKGGGNQFGIVTQFTVAAHPIEDFWGGIIIYDGKYTPQILEMGRQFTNNNTDPKAAIILTQSHLGTPDLLEKIGLNIPGLDTLVIVFNVYNGPDGTAAFKSYTDIPHVIDLRKRQKYSDLTSQQDIGALTTGGSLFRTATHRSDDPQKVQDLLKAFDDFSDEVKGTYGLVSFDFQPIPAATVEQSRAQGGNAMRSIDGPYFFLNFLFSYTIGAPGVTEALAKFKQLVADSQGDDDLPLFLNDAAADQPVFQRYGAYNELKAAKAKYDPTNFLTTNMGGPRFNV